MKPKLVVFDLDDTLYLERDYVRSGFTAVGEWAETNLGIHGFGDASWRHFIKGVRERIFNRVLSEMGLPESEAAVNQLVEVYRGHHPDIRLLTEAEGVIRALSNHAHLAIISDGALRTQRLKVETLGLDKYFDQIIFTDEYGHNFWKPHPRAFRDLQKRILLDSDKCVYVGDNPLKDFEAPAALGWKSVRVRHPLGLYCHLDSCTGHLPDWEVTELTSLCDVLVKFFGGEGRCEFQKK